MDPKPGSRMTPPGLSVIIPTYNRLPVLQRCLEALRVQTLDRSSFEIIVIDDGSRDGTRSFLTEQSDVRVWLQPRNSGPAAARNAGIRMAEGEIVLFIGDDIYLRRDALALHQEAHARENTDGKLAVLGYCPWWENAEVTPLMRCVMDGRVFPQFHYYAIKDRSNLHYSYFYTSNVSVSRSLLDRYGMFDESFRHAMGEDGELGLRLQRAGLRIEFRPEIVGYHDHPTSYASVRRRARVSGEVSYLLYEKHPEIAGRLWLDEWSPRQHATMRLKRHLAERVMDPLLTFADERRLESRLVWGAWNWALQVHKTGAFIDTARRRRGGTSALAPKGPGVGSASGSTAARAAQ